MSSESAIKEEEKPVKNGEKEVPEDLKKLGKLLGLESGKKSKETPVKAECSKKVVPDKSKNNRKENHVDVAKTEKSKLLEILERQKKVASNKFALKKLPDKGEKILSLIKEIEDELQKRESSANIHEAMAGLSLNADLNEIEWSGKIGNRSVKKVDENKEETNPFRILATHSGTEFNKKIVKKEEAPEELVTEQDIEDIYAINLCNKVDKVEARTRYLPHKTLNKTKEVSKDKKRDLSAATPPISKFGTLKLVTLEDSLKLQMHQAQHLKEVQVKHAAERLKDKTYKIGEVMPSEESIKVYREATTNDSDEEEEVRDECEGHDSGDVVFPVDHEE